MSAPDTNLKKQEKRHWGPIAGITLAILVAIIWMFFWSGAEDVTEADAQDGVAEITATENEPDVVMDEAEDTN